MEVVTPRRGILMFAHNNAEIDYLKVAYLNAIMAKRHLGVPVTLITNDGTLDYGKEEIGEDELYDVFENIIIERNAIVSRERNKRVYSDGLDHSVMLDFLNTDHYTAYDYTPYDETLFIDSDYLIMSDKLSKCWGSVHDVMVCDDIMDVSDTNSHSGYINQLSAKLFWATCIYFKKSDYAKKLFDTVKHVSVYYGYYRDLYNLDASMFRNDYAFSIAIHLFGGMGHNDDIARLPIGGMTMAFDTDEIASVNEIGNTTLLVTREGKRTLTTFTDTDLHVMNKWSILRHYDDFMDIYQHNKG